ncbi:MAG: hypothetical protein HOC74_09370 [Gemmatimonadetes bacterium]|jgi:uncharacterized protein (DUF433 family)|nr:hypothetical protein [Gemmatimonadota bacterium]
MEKQYVEKRDQGYWVTDSRVSLDSVILAFLDGLSPETIAAECFPVLSLEQVYGAVTFYLAHQTEIDAHIQRAEIEYESLRKATRATDPTFSEKLTKAYRQSQKFQP